VPRIVLLVTSPRLPAGLLTAQAWDLVRTYPVLAAAENDATVALRASGAAVTIVPSDVPKAPDAPHAPQAEVLLATAAQHETVVWLAGPGGDQTLARELGMRLARAPHLAAEPDGSARKLTAEPDGSARELTAEPDGSARELTAEPDGSARELTELELMYGSWDPAGARLLDVVTVMDRLVSPGGDPWKREQTHQTLARYLLEEAYEAYDAIAAHDLDALREELGDVLLQVVLHSRMAEDAQAPWSVDDLAGDLVEKLVRRNPHVFGGEEVVGVDQIIENWERIKREEKARDSVLDGIALSQPALALAAKILSRAQRAGIAVPVPAPPTELADPATDVADSDALGAALLALVRAALAHGLDPEGALRRAALSHAEAVRRAEAA
jgi:XTP/dITP diphosphohydrolase